MNGKRIFWKSLPIVALALAGGRAHAQDCVLGANAVVVTGSTAMAPVIKAVAVPLQTAGMIDVFYENSGSCTGTRAYLGIEAADRGGKSVTHYDMAGAATTCTLPAGTMAAMAVSDVFPEVCTDDNKKPDGVGDFHGPVQAMTFVVPKQSSQKFLVAEQGYFVFGFGTAGYLGMTIAPWTDQMSFAIRNVGSGTQQMTSRAVGLTAAQMKGVDKGGSGGVVSALKAATTVAMADPMIGILGAETYDVNREFLKVLAFQGFKQKYAYYPDSSSTAFDKKNVRDGHYTVWGPVHMIAKTGADGKAMNAKVQDLIDYLQFKKPLGTVNLIDVVSKDAHVVPECAMRVTRTTELGPLSPWSPAPGTGCACRFEEITKGAGMSGCKPCTMNTECDGGKMCSNGFCE
jgi:hypothetical protein